jgi:hypothetical protein
MRRQIAVAERMGTAMGTLHIVGEEPAGEAVDDEQQTEKTTTTASTGACSNRRMMMRSMATPVTKPNASASANAAQ